MLQARAAEIKAVNREKRKADKEFKELCKTEAEVDKDMAVTQQKLTWLKEQFQNIKTAAQGTALVVPDYPVVQQQQPKAQQLVSCTFLQNHQVRVICAY